MFSLLTHCIYPTLSVALSAFLGFLSLCDSSGVMFLARFVLTGSVPAFWSEGFALWFHMRFAGGRLNTLPSFTSILMDCLSSLPRTMWSLASTSHPTQFNDFGSGSSRVLSGHLILAWGSSSIAPLSNPAGIGLLIIQLMLFPSLEKIVGPIFLIRATAVISIPVLTIYPFIAMLRGIQLWIAINVASLIKNILAIMIITGTHVLLNNAVDDDRRATANGLQMSAMSFFKAMGPTGAGIVFSWSQKRQHADFFPGFHLVCLFLNIVVIIFVFMTLDPILPRSTNKPVANAQRNSPHEEEPHAEEEERHGFS